MGAAFSWGFFGNVWKGALRPVELSETEGAFVGKWKGTRLDMVWEIERFSDRTFEIVIEEPDYEDSTIIYKNYAEGVWRIEGDYYYYEWVRWWGDEGDLGGEVFERVGSVSENKVITLSEEDEEDPENIEVRVDVFEMSIWNLKP